MGPGQEPEAERVPVSRTQETNYLAKLSSEPGARGATAEGESENTSTSSPPEEGGGPAGAGGAAPRPKRSADGEGVDWKTGKVRVSGKPAHTPEPSRHRCLHPPPPTAPARPRRTSAQHGSGSVPQGQACSPQLEGQS